MRAQDGAAGLLTARQALQIEKTGRLHRVDDEVVDDEVVDDEVTVASLQEVAPWIERSNDARM
jgi:hypothetical protein